MSEFRFCCSFADFCQLAYPRRYRDQPTPDLIALRDTYKADMVQPYPGLTDGEIDCHLAITEELITDLEHELALRKVGGVDIAAAIREARRYPPAFVQAVRDANTFIRLVADDTGQAPPGTMRRSRTIRSPFRHDTSPSFAVYTGGHWWYDHGTHEWGDAITCVMRQHDRQTRRGAGPAARRLRHLCGPAQRRGGERGDMLDTMASVVQTARERDCGVIVIHHLRKSDGGGVDMVRGSSAIVGKADAVFFDVLRDAEEQSLCLVLIQRKARFTREAAPRYLHLETDEDENQNLVRFRRYLPTTKPERPATGERPTARSEGIQQATAILAEQPAIGMWDLTQALIRQGYTRSTAYRAARQVIEQPSRELPTPDGDDQFQFQCHLGHPPQDETETETGTEHVMPISVGAASHYPACGRVYSWHDVL